MEYNKGPVPMLKNILSTPALLCAWILYRLALEVTTSIKVKQTLSKILCKDVDIFNDTDMVSVL